MSCYGWERGEIKLPASEFSTFKKSLLSQLTSRRDQLLSKANSIYETIKTEEKGKRNFPIQARIQELLNPRETSHWGSSRQAYSYDETDMITRSLVKENKLVKPKKNDFAITDKDTFHEEELTVRLVSKTKTLIWNVDDNNRSVDRAHECYLGRTTLSLLSRVSFTNRTGGVFEGNDEYNRDDGSGGNYVTKRFGKYADPKFIKNELLAQARALRMQAKYMRAG